ncbi:CMGC/SRPK protein kinase [Schizosaccharomyces japonicus yFS275]|uniref:non-specific serine/threonine protein kinase n=1 Tax=Schizosaccharomyces japonicus (strain yFS275 / FY16936) TaxID=402676 RepID=B6JXW0_SCHJY|nr:CMGC/SRPK protein kinase [Schizosaccharomyces japonicus yFS275]EEB06378.2 CMGC/SRPK protein kinase [Schizosaccharomyces japonicus yFS275]
MNYGPGGYHVTHIGDSLKGGQYTIIRKLGWGQFSTVWLAKDNKHNHYRVVKICRSSRAHRENAIDEIRILRKVNSKRNTHPGRRHIVELLDYFEVQGPNGVHVCLVFETLGQNLLSVMRSFRSYNIPMCLVRRFTKQLLLGLDFLHRECGIIHTDLKPENVLIRINDDDLVDCLSDIYEAEEDTVGDITRSRPLCSAALERYASQYIKVGKYYQLKRAIKATSSHETQHLYKEQLRQLEKQLPPNYQVLGKHAILVSVVIADLGNSCLTDFHFTDEIQTRQYRAPEIILHHPWGASTDCWSLACMVFELLTSEYLFNPKNDSEVSRDEMHLLLFESVLGDLPEFMLRKLKRKGTYLYKTNGKRRNVKHRMSIESMLVKRHNFEPTHARMIESFLKPLLVYEPQKRADTRSMLSHAWFTGNIHSESVHYSFDKIEGWGSLASRNKLPISS